MFFVWKSLARILFFVAFIFSFYGRPAAKLIYVPGVKVI